MRKIKIIATILAMTMVLGSTMSVYATTYNTALADLESKDNDIDQYRAHMYTPSHAQDVRDNRVPAGTYIDSSLESGFEASVLSFRQLVTAQNGESELESAHNTTYTDLVAQYNSIMNSRITSDGSNYTSSSSSSSGSSSSSSSSRPLDAGEEEMSFGENYEEIQNLLTSNIDNNINTSLNKINTLIASGDTAQAQAAMSQGATIDFTKDLPWLRSLYKNRFAQIEKATSAGIPVTIVFYFGGNQNLKQQKYCVTIPAGAKVTELCDDVNHGWCGFLNLAAHYGFTVLQ